MNGMEWCIPSRNAEPLAFGGKMFIFLKPASICYFWCKNVDTSCSLPVKWIGDNWLPENMTFSGGKTILQNAAVIQLLGATRHKKLREKAKLITRLGP